tara:strand:- start:20862 stop:20996 length:135 start_codon:yes stop_codon:yes gene_type:complete
MGKDRSVEEIFSTNKEHNLGQINNAVLYIQFDREQALLYFGVMI